MTDLITCPENSDICTTMAGAGAGIGLLLQYLGQALPALLIILGVVGIVVVIGVSVGKAIAGSIKGVHTR